MADIAIMSMLFESTAVVSVNGFLHLYQLIFLENDSLLTLLRSFVIRTSVPLVIEWFFTSLSLAIETRYQNMAVMAVWRRQWKRHILTAVVNVFPVALWTSVNLLGVVHGRFSKLINQPCKMPFSLKQGFTVVQRKTKVPLLALRTSSFDARENSINSSIPEYAP